MTPTLRRLDDRERYWGLTWPGWAAAIIAGLVLYLAVRFSPLSTKATITVTLFILAFAAMAYYGISGQALSPGRQLLAIIAYQRSPKRLALPATPDRRGLVLDAVPDLHATHVAAEAFELSSNVELDADMDAAVIGPEGEGQ